MVFRGTTNLKIPGNLLTNWLVKIDLDCLFLVLHPSVSQKGELCKPLIVDLSSKYSQIPWLSKDNMSNEYIYI